MKKIIVASTNPVKIDAVKQGFERMFPGVDFEYSGVAVASGVLDQPMSSSDTLQGAHTRAMNASQEVSEAEYWVGLEGGVEKVNGEMQAFAWIVVRSLVRIGKARTAAYYLPPEVVRLIDEGKELGEADDIVFQRSNSKQENGSVGILTGNVIDRAGFYRDAVILALIPFKNEELY